MSKLGKFHMNLLITRCHKGQKTETDQSNNKQTRLFLTYLFESQLQHVRHECTAHHSWQLSDNSGCMLAYRWDWEQCRLTISMCLLPSEDAKAHHTPSQSAGGRERPDLWINQNLWEKKKSAFAYVKRNIYFFSKYIAGSDAYMMLIRVVFWQCFL